MFQNVNYLLYSEKIKTPITFVMLADLHNYVYGNDNEILLSAIREQRPDFVCLAGDMLVGNSQISYEPAQKLLKKLAEEYDVFYGLGNHEARMKQDLHIYGTLYEDYMKPLREAGVHVLENERKHILVRGNELNICGYDLPMKYFEKFNRYVFEATQIEEVLGICESFGDIYNILLAHNPMYFQQYAQWGADLTLSGHLHGGIIRLPFLGGIITPQAKLFPKYCAGKYQIDEKYLVVSRGLGAHTIPIRLNNPTELSVIHLEPAEIKKK